MRFLAAGLGIAVAGVAFLATLREPPDWQGKTLFIVLALLAFVYCLLSGILTTSDCVSEEKRDGTLGLLFLTDLRGYDVVIGKFVAHSVRAISALLVLLPLIRLPMLMGGVSLDAVWCLALVLINTMFLSLVTGVLVSVLARDARHAVGGTILFLAVLLLILPVIRWVAVEYVLRPNPIGPLGAPPGMTLGIPEPLGWLLLVNPALPLASTIEVLLRGTPPPAFFWISLASQHALAWLSLIAACFILPGAWQDRTNAQARTLTDALGIEKEGPSRAAHQTTPFRTPILDQSPFAWLVARERRPIVFTWLGLAVILGVWLWGFGEVKEDWLQGAVGLTTVFFCAFWLKLRVASLASRHLQEQRQSGALELILCTPQTASDMIRGYLLGLQRVMFSPIATVLIASFLLLFAGLRQSMSGNEGIELLLTFVVGLGILGLDLWTLAWGGLWFGFQSRRYIRGYVLTLMWVLALPWVLFLLSLILMGVAMETFNLAPGLEVSYASILGWWALLAVAVDLRVLYVARRGLHHALREIAAEDGSGPASKPQAPIAGGTLLAPPAEGQSVNPSF